MRYSHPFTRVAKRLVDVIGASLGLVVTLPIWPLIALATKLEDGGPVFFRQLRVGQTHADRTDLFMMIKFRTMRVDAEAYTGAVWAQERDPRITAVGGFLRKTRLDELPQLLNVLAGDMSLVGPRPERPGIVGKLARAIPFYDERLVGVTPGITGLAQIETGYDTCLDDVRRKLLYDHSYALALHHPLHWACRDAEIVGRTLLTIVGAKGR